MALLCCHPSTHMPDDPPVGECSRFDETFSSDRQTAHTAPGCCPSQSRKTWEALILYKKILGEKVLPGDSAVLPAHPLHLQLALVDDLLQAHRVSVPNLTTRRGVRTREKVFTKCLR